MSRFVLLFIILVSLRSEALAQFHLFTNKQGVQITAEIVSVNPDWKSMTIRKDGNSFDIEPNVLVLDDQQWVKNWLKERGITAPVGGGAAATPRPAPAGTPAPAPVPTTTPQTIDPSQVQLRFDVKKKMLDSDRRKYSTYMRLDTKKYAYDITVTSLGRTPVPAVDIEYAAVWKESVSFSNGATSYSTFSSSKNEFALKGKKSLPQMTYNRSESLTTDTVEINSIVYDGNEHYREDLLLGLVVNVSLADGTKIEEYLSAESEGKGLTWDDAKDLRSKPSYSSSTRDDDDDMANGRYNLQLKKGQSEDGPINFEGKRITIRAKVSPDVKGPDGVVVAIGGSGQGMSLYVKERQVYACITKGQDLKWVAKPTPLGEFEAEVALNSSGLSLTIDNGSPAKRADVELFGSLTTEGIDVGQDTGSAAGDYEDGFDFAGEIEDVRILIRE